jgi:hypothetical protein
MDRRTFLKNSSVVAGAILISPSLSLAGNRLNIPDVAQRYSGAGIIEDLISQFGFKYLETNQERYAREDALDPDPRCKTWHPDYIEWIYRSTQLEEVEPGMLEEIFVLFVSEKERAEDINGRNWAYYIDHEIGNTKQLYMDLDYTRRGGRPYESLDQLFEKFPADLHRARRNASRLEICPGTRKSPMPSEKYMSWAKERGFAHV